jgi:hypothetical protein
MLTRCFSIPQARLGWLLILVGVFVWLGFGCHADWSSLRFYTATLKRTEGVIESVAPTGFFAGSEGAYKSVI